MNKSITSQSCFFLRGTLFSVITGKDQPNSFNHFLLHNSITVSHSKVLSRKKDEAPSFVSNKPEVHTSIWSNQHRLPCPSSLWSSVGTEFSRGRTAESVGRGEKTGRSVWSNMHSKYIKVQPLRDRYKPLPTDKIAMIKQKSTYENITFSVSNLAG